MSIHDTGPEGRRGGEEEGQGPDCKLQASEAEMQKDAGSRFGFRCPAPRRAASLEVGRMEVQVCVLVRQSPPPARR